MFSLQRVFHLEKNQTTVRREPLAGLTTFVTMAYVVVVNPQILSESGSLSVALRLARLGVARYLGVPFGVNE